MMHEPENLPGKMTDISYNIVTNFYILILLPLKFSNGPNEAVQL